MKKGISRRHVLTGAVACMLATPTLSHARQPRQSYVECLKSIAGPSASSPLTIDAHCHVFNGRDIPIKDFFQRVLLNSDEYTDIGKIAGFNAAITARSILWSIRKADKEFTKLDSLFTQLDPSDAACHWYSRRQNGIHKDLPKEKIVEDFARFYTQYRTFNAMDLMAIYPDVHLFTPALVDLYSGVGPTSKTSDNVTQLAIAERICRLTRGRMHFLAGFDPMRQVLHDRDPSGGYTDQLDLVKQAVDERGFIGVKLYPPMGFAPIGNAARACPPAVYKFLGRAQSTESFRAEYGALIDNVLERLFCWAEANDVPIMAHAAASNFSNRACATDDPATTDRNEASDFDTLEAGYYLGNAAQWGELLANHKALRLNLAHYDHQDVFLSKKGNEGLTAAAAKLNDVARSHDNVYLDLSHFDGIRSLSTQSGLAKLLGKLAGDPVAGRLMYGSDWHMLARVYGNQYFHQRMRQSISAPIADGFFGRNAARFLGLEPGQETRKRIEAFYKKHDMAPPTWMQMLS
jgi:predicted TIM-barrel fold metal-dependent hydrolase